MMLIYNFLMSHTLFSVAMLSASALFLWALIIFFLEGLGSKACDICPHIGLEICNDCTKEDRERIIILYKDDKIYG